MIGIRKLGPGYQYQIKWRGTDETTWEAASRARRQIPALVQAFEEEPRQQQQQSQSQSLADGKVADVSNVGGSDHSAPEAAREGAAALAADGSSMRAQMEALQRLVRQQAQQLQQLRASPSPSPSPAPQPAPQHSPQHDQRSIPTAVVAAAVDSHSRFARKEPRAQDLREYDGASGAKLDDWLDELGSAVDLFRLNEREAVDFGTSRLRGAARQWWNGLGAAAKAGIEGADALAAALRMRFQPVTTQRLAREQLRALRQGSRHINDYIAEFQRLRALLSDMSEADALFAFESGVSPSIALELRKQGSANLTDALTLAARIGGIASAAGAGPHGRMTAAHQMEINEGDSVALEDRITRSVLNALHAQGAGSHNMKGQSHLRGNQSERGRPGSRGGFRGSRGGRFGGNRAPPAVPGVQAEVVQQRWDAGQCLRCGSSDHISHACPNAISASRSLN